MSQLIDARIDSNSRVFFVKGEHTAIVDTGAPGNERKILKALREADIPQGNVSLLIVTHAHWDHCGSLQALKAALKVPVMAGRPDSEYLEKGENSPVSRSTAKHARYLGFGQTKVEAAVIEDRDLKEYGIDARVFRTPGHSEGSISVLAADGNCAVGDFLAGVYTGDAEDVDQSLKRIMEGGARRFCPSHGPDVDAEAILRILKGS